MPKTVTMQKIEGGKPGKVYYPLEITQQPTPTLKPNDLLIQISSTALNHRDLFLRQHLYPAPSFDTPILADGCGTVTEIGPNADKKWLGKRVVLTPGRGWKDDPFGPEDPKGYQILGGTSTIPIGTLCEEVVIDAEEVEEAPGHLSDAEAAALPLTGLTAWRALVSKGGEANGNVGKGKNVLITGIGGGVALNALQFAVGKGCNVFVTSGDQAKIDKAVGLGAKGGVSYRGEEWEKELKGLLGKNATLDLIIDGAGGDIVKKSLRLMKQGGTIVQYGMTISPQMTWSMPANLRNFELKGSTMGSRKEFRDMVAFVNEQKIKPVVSRVVKGIENLKEIDELFEEMRKGSQFGKLVVEVKSAGVESKL